MVTGLSSSATDSHIISIINRLHQTDCTNELTSNTVHAMYVYVHDTNVTSMSKKTSICIKWVKWTKRNLPLKFAFIGWTMEVIKVVEKALTKKATGTSMLIIFLVTTSTDKCSVFPQAGEWTWITVSHGINIKKQENMQRPENSFLPFSFTSRFMSKLNESLCCKYGSGEGSYVHIANYWNTTMTTNTTSSITNILTIFSYAFDSFDNLYFTK